MDKEFLQLKSDRDKLKYLLSHQISKKLNQDKTFGIKFADKVSKYSTSWIFLIVYLVCIGAWMIFNFVAPIYVQFDQYPFNFLSLAISVFLSIQSFLIGVSQHRQAKMQKEKDEYEYDVNLKTELLTTEIYKMLSDKKDKED